MARTITNYATLDYVSGTNAQTAVSNVAQATIRETFSITKDAYRSDYQRGDTLTYIVQIVSTGGSATSLTVIDDLGTYTENGIAYTPLEFESYQLYVGQALNPPVGGVNVTVTPSTDQVSFTFDNLPVPFTGLTLIMQMRVNEYAPIGQLSNTITNTTSLVIAGSTVASGSATVEAQSYADLQILKSMTPDPVTEGGRLTYTFVICNYGTTSPAEVTLRDRFVPSPGIPLSVAVDGVSVDQFDYNGATGMFVFGSGAQDSYILSIPPATFTRDPVTGVIAVSPSTTTVTVSGIINL